MKKLTVLLLVVAMLFSISAFSASANDVCENYGDVPKLEGSTITIDGLKEDAYNQGLKITCDRHGGGDGTPIDGMAYLLYDDNNLYIYFEVRDSQKWDILNDIHICSQCGKQMITGSGCEHVTEANSDPYNLWNDDCIEFMVDWTNDGTPARQYRISRSGFMSRDWDTWNEYTGFSGKGYDNGDYWYAEFAIPLDNSSIGTTIGITAMLHSQDSNDPYVEYYAMMQNSSDMGGPWDSIYFDYITLGKALENAKTDIVAPDIGNGSTGEGNTGLGDNNTGNGGTTNNGGTTGGAANGPAQTADPIVMVVLVAVAALGAAVILKKTCFNR